jgi:hypothetical protein
MHFQRDCALLPALSTAARYRYLKARGAPMLAA